MFPVLIYQKAFLERCPKDMHLVRISECEYKNGGGFQHAASIDGIKYNKVF